MKQKIFALIIFALFLSLPKLLLSVSFTPESCKQAMVVTADPIATEVGLEVLRQGGNAVDAAVAVGFALAVTYPEAGNIGGGGFMLIRTGQEISALDYRETAPAAATPDMYLDENGRVVTNASTFGYRSCGVPGTVRGLWKAHKKYGRLSWKKLLQPAIRLAQEGFLLDAYRARLFNAFKDSLAKFPATKKIFVKKNGDNFQPGERFIQRDLAQTLERIARYGADEFYTGKTAHLIVTDIKKNGGLFTLEDLKDYRAKWRTPIHFTYRGYDVYSMPPPSSGGILLAEILNTLENFDLTRLGINSAALIRLWVETERQAYADRAYYLGDPDFVKMPVNLLISKKYAQQIRAHLHLLYPAKSDSIRPGLTFVQEKEQTTHFSIVDPWGNAVSNTYTLNGNFGSFAVVEGTGFFLNNEMDDFSIKPGHPNIYGLVGGTANEIAPGKRMLSSMTPTIVLKNKELFMVLGAPGGSKIITAVAQVLSNVIDHHMNIRMAIESPRFHHQWKPDTIFVEKNRFNRDTIHILQSAGYRIFEKDQMGFVQGILIEHGMRNGWSDPRSNGKAKGF